MEIPLATVGALILNSKGEALMVRTHKWSEQVGIPGAKSNGAKPPKPRCARESKEETNLKVTDIQFSAGAGLHPLKKEFYRDAHFVLLNYTCRVTGKPAVKLNHEAQEFQWVTLTDAKKLKLNKPTKILIEAVLIKS